MQANEMNISHWLDPKLQYDFLFHSIRAKKRFFKKKKTTTDPAFEQVKEYYKYNDKRTKEALAILTKEQLDIIKNKNNKGGIK